MNVGELVDELMGVSDGVVDFEKEVIGEETLVCVLTEDGTILSVKRIEFEPDESFLTGTLWLHASEM